MIDIFVSRPTWVAQEFEKGLNNFLTFIQTQNFNPRTIGKTDYPTESPLDEVIATMDNCKGVIILGYPQILIESGTIKDSQIKEVWLPTEWNHIEASLAYSQDMPLLVIHHTGIKRGIFDHGAISKFIYEKDLSENDWFFSPEIKGALQKWENAVLSRNERKSRSAERKLIPSPQELDEQTKNILLYLFENKDDSSRHVETVATAFDLNRETAQYYLDELTEYGIIRISSFSGIKGITYYTFTTQGREFVVTRILAKSL